MFLKSIFASEYSIFLHLNVRFFENSFMLKITKSAHFQITFVSSFIFVICFYFIKKKVHSPVVFFFSTHFPMNFSILSLSFIFFLHTLKMKGKNYVEVLLSGMMTIEFFLIPFCTMKLIFNLFKIFFFFERNAETFVETLRAAVLSAGALRRIYACNAYDTQSVVCL